VAIRPVLVVQLVDGIPDHNKLFHTLLIVCTKAALLAVFGAVFHSTLFVGFFTRTEGQVFD